MISPITLKTDQGDGWLCEVHKTGDEAYIYQSFASDYPDDAEFMASLVPNRNDYPKWFVNGIAPIDTPIVKLDRIHEGWDPYLDLMAKARMCRKVIDLSDRSKVWYVGMDVEYYLEEYEYD